MTASRFNRLGELPVVLAALPFGRMRPRHA